MTVKRSSILTVLNIISVFAFSASAAARVQDNLGLIPDNPTAKTSLESWEQYVSRLNATGIVSDSEMQQWQAGNSIDVMRQVPVTRIRTETRTRTVSVNRTRTETWDDGTEHAVPYAENVAQNYTVAVPYTENVVQVFSIPAPGSQPRTATNKGITRPSSVLSKPSPVARPNVVTRPPNSNDFQKDSVKKQTETWQKYVARLREANVLTEAQIATWNKGKEVEVERTMNFVCYRPETRSRTIPVTKMVMETTEEGTDVLVPKTENVTQSYTVQVPYTETRIVTIKIPALGSKANHAVNSGVKFKRLISSQTKSASHNSTLSSRMAAMLRIKPKQSDSNYKQPEKAEDLRIERMSSGGVNGWEVRNKHGQLARRFIDINNDGKVDNWIFFSNGKEIYRDVDLDFDGKTDQYQYTQGDIIRFGIDDNQDGMIDRWESGRR